MEHDYSSITSLISQIHSEASSFLKMKLEQEGLPEFVSSHGNILFQLTQTEKLTMTELAKRINRDKSTTTVLVRKLESAGFIERERSSEDNRVIHIRLSPQGRVYTEATGKISKQLNETCYTGFSEEEKATIFSLLLKISENFTNSRK
jgi:DNA-binding MarR family transcriptional regulator